MRAHNLALLAILAAGSWSGAVYAQPNYPPPPPEPGYGNQDYDNPPSDNQGYDDQNPYYDDQGPDDPYDNPDPNEDPAYYDQGAYNQGPADVSIFYSSLHPYGRWIQHARYGWVWEPTRVRVGWQPYTVGRWVNTEYGWTWVSDEPWGWATYHYGRWLADPEYGWLWVPGREWGPAWCSFQQGDGYIGWAPLPPSVGFQVGFGIQLGGLRLSAVLAPTAYSFVPERAFLESRIDRVIVPRARNVAFFRTTRDITNIRVFNNRIVNQSVPLQRIEQVTGRRVQRFRVAEVRNPGQAPRGGQFQGDQVRIFRPAPTLAPTRSDVTPQAVINRRAQLERRQPGQPAPGRPDGRWQRQPPPQPGSAQPAPDRQPRGRQQPEQPGQPAPVPQPGQPPRWQRQRPAASQEDLDRKHQAEQQQLQTQQSEERNRLQQMHQQELRDRQNQRNQARAQQVQAQHEAEMQAQRQEEQREQQLLRERQRRERPAPAARPAPPQDRQDRRNQGQDRGRRNEGQDQGNRRERRQQPPPPPPPPKTQ